MLDMRSSSKKGAFMMRNLMIKKGLRRMIIGMTLLCVCLPSLFFLVKRALNSSRQQVDAFFTPKQVVYEICLIDNEEIKQQIDAHIKSKTTAKSLLAFDPQLFYKELKQKFLLVKTVEVKYLVPHTLSLKVIGVTPKFVVNDTYVIGDKKRIFAKELFTDGCLDNLPRLTLDKRWLTKKLDQGLYDFLNKIPAATWQQYDITFYEWTNIHLAPHKSVCKCRIVVDEKSFFEQRKFDLLGVVFKDLCERGTITKKVLDSQKTQLAFDFRIKNEIIVKYYGALRRGRGI